MSGFRVVGASITEPPTFSRRPVAAEAARQWARDHDEWAGAETLGADGWSLYADFHPGGFTKDEVPAHDFESQPGTLLCRRCSRSDRAHQEST